MGLSGSTLAEPKMDTQGPILESFSKPSTNSAMILNICQVSIALLSFQSRVLLEKLKGKFVLFNVVL